MGLLNELNQITDNTVSDNVIKGYHLRTLWNMGVKASDADESESLIYIEELLKEIASKMNIPFPNFTDEERQGDGYVIYKLSNVLDVILTKEELHTSGIKVKGSNISNIVELYFKYIK